MPGPAYQRQGKTAYLVVIIICIVSLIFFAYSSRLDNENNKARGISITDILGDGDQTGYARANSHREFSFPVDHGPHPDYRHEWWYYTGNLETESGRHFGYQLTFFRFSLKPQMAEHRSPWAATQMMMAHFTLSDIEGNNFYPFEKTSRVAVDIAGGMAQPFKVWIDNWHATGSPEGMWPLKLYAVQDDIEINLSLDPAKPLVLQGDRGLSRKSNEAGNASYYYSYSHLKTQGVLRIGGDQHEVSGLSWLDREWGTSSLSRDQAGWDWFALQLSDDTELMVYQLRRKNGNVDSFSSGTIIDAEGSTYPLTSQDFNIEVLKQWQSPHTQILYPARWRLTVPVRNLYIEITPLLDDQELHASLNYWEGAVRIMGNYDDKKVEGYGYAELTGYDQTGVAIFAK